MDLYEQVMEAAAVIQARSGLKPAVGLILGSGLGDLAAEILGCDSYSLRGDPAFSAFDRCRACGPPAAGDA